MGDRVVDPQPLCHRELDDRERRARSARSRTCAAAHVVAERAQRRQLRRAEEDRCSAPDRSRCTSRISATRRSARGVNIGAGTITCNYDGVSKQPTIDRGRRVRRQRHAAHRAGDRRQGRVRRHRHDDRAKTSRRARSPSARASSGTSRAGSRQRRRTKQLEGTEGINSHVRNHRLHRTEGRRARPHRRPAAARVSRLRLGGRRRRAQRRHRAAAQRRQAVEARRRHHRPIRCRATTASATRAGRRTGARPRRTRIRTATAPARSSSSTTASSRTTST